MLFDLAGILKNRLFLFIIFCNVFFLSCKNNPSDESIKKIKTYPDNSVEYVYTKDGFERDFILCLPDAFDSAEKETVPLIFVLHGYGNTAFGFKQDIHFEKTACSSGYAVCYVSGKSNPSSFNQRNCWSYGDDEWSEKDMDNLADLARFLQKKFGFCSEKISAVGFSNGAIMATKIAVEKSEIFSAVVSVSGMMSDNVWKKALKKNPEKISRYFQINGTADEIVPVRNSKKAFYNPMPPYEEDVLEFLSGKKISEVKSEALSEKTQLYKFNSRVFWAVIQDGTHTWPDERWSGINASTLIIDFLLQ